jgi:CheY-like chemotaxis protein
VASVLFVDDDLDGCEAVVRYFNRAGHVTRCVPNGREALSALANQTPDVVILDLRMPEMDGLTFLEVIRCYLRWSFLPVILLTASKIEHAIARAEQLGVRRVFHKADFKLSDLLDAVNEMLPHHEDESSLVG